MSTPNQFVDACRRVSPMTYTHARAGRYTEDPSTCVYNSVTCGFSNPSSDRPPYKQATRPSDQGALSDSPQPFPIASTRQDSTRHQPTPIPRPQGQTDDSQGVEIMTATPVIKSSFVYVRDPLRLVPRTASQLKQRGVYPCQHDQSHGARHHAAHTERHARSIAASNEHPTPETAAQQQSEDTAQHTDGHAPASSPATRCVTTDVVDQRPRSITSRRSAHTMTGLSGSVISCRVADRATSATLRVRDDPPRYPCHKKLIFWRAEPAAIRLPKDRPGFASIVSGGL